MEDQETKVAADENAPQVAEAPVETPAQTTKERVLAARGVAVPLDYFLYSCLEQERLDKAKRGAQGPEWRWPMLHNLAAGGDSLSTEMAGSSIEALLGSLVAWHRDAFPVLAQAVPLDHEHLHEIVPYFVALSRDLAQLYRLKLGGELPIYDKNAAQSQVWATIDQLFSQNFPTYKPLFLRYLQWTHAVEAKEEFEPGSRPPVGRYAPPPLPRTGGRDGRDSRSGGGGGGFGRGGSDRGGPRGGRPMAPRYPTSDDRPRPNQGGERSGGGQEVDEHGDGPAPGNEAIAPRTDRGERPEREERPAHHDRGEQDAAGRGSREGSGSQGPRTSGRGPRPEGGRPPRRDDRGPRRPRSDDDEATVRQTAVSLAEVDEAISSLQKSQDLQEVVLKPANSFYRRLQHQKIVDAGFQSQSVGEGPDRAVRISR